MGYSSRREGAANTELGVQKMSDALASIEEYFQRFRDGVERCRSSKSEGKFSASDWEDAYERLYRLFNRYHKEKRRFAKSERTALSKPFENDTFIQSLLGYRVVGSHIKSNVALKRGGFEIRDGSGASVSLGADVSALEMFAGPVVTLNDIQGRPQRIDHLANLEVAEKRIAAAFDKLSM